MKLYFIRHGQSEYNQQGIYQSGDVPLSIVGIKQTEYLSKRFEQIPIDLIIASDYLRSMQTAQIIAEKVHSEIIYTHSLRELKNPTEIIGRPYFDEGAYKIKKLIMQNTKSAWHYSDEENITDLKNRAQKFVRLLKGFDREHILVISHAAIIKMIVCLLVFEDLANEKLYRYFDRSWDLYNTSITEVTKDDENFYSVRVWNDDKHLP